VSLIGTLAFSRIFIFEIFRNRRAPVSDRIAQAFELFGQMETLWHRVAELNKAPFTTQ
jgi:hypothetical protein